MCGKQRTCRIAILYVWQGKGLRADFAYVWQGKELAGKSGEWRVTSGERKHRSPPTPPSSSDKYQNKGVVGKEIRKNMKIKERQNVTRRRMCIGANRVASRSGGDGRPASRRDFFLGLCPIWLAVGSPRRGVRACEPQGRLVHGLRYGREYARTTGRGDGLGAGGRPSLPETKIQNLMLYRTKHSARGYCPDFSTLWAML